MALRGERLDKPSYSILRSLKGGTSGEVYEADHLVFGRKCVQKTYSTLGLEDAAAHREPRLLHRIKHDHVAEVLEAQYDKDVENAITFVSIFYEGRCIAKAFDEGYRFSVHQAVRLAIQVLDALAYVHSKPDLLVIHRDVKPGNIFLDASRTHARLGDWGSAARIEPDGQVAGIEGSPLYTPPEAGPANGRMGVAGDVYGVGMTLFEMLNGPFEYSSIDPARVDARLTKGQTDALTILNLEISATLHDIKARYKELVKRYHPDANGGDRGAEERLKKVIKAYGHLRATGLA